MHCHTWYRFKFHELWQYLQNNHRDSFFLTFFSLIVSKLGFHPLPDNSLLKYSGVPSNISGKNAGTNLSSVLSTCSFFCDKNSCSLPTLAGHIRANKGRNLDEDNRDFECKTEFALKRRRRASSLDNETSFPRFIGSIM